MRAKPTEVDLSAEPPVGLNVCDPLCPLLAEPRRSQALKPTGGDGSHSSRSRMLRYNFC